MLIYFKNITKCKFGGGINLEIERKFLVNEDKLLTEISLDNYDKYSIEQAYISTEDREVRIRKIENSYSKSKCFMTIKSKDDLVRKEVEFEIPYNKYQDLISLEMYKGNIINKLRYKVPLENGLIAEIDIYRQQLFGLVMVEVEFKTEEEAQLFQKPNWFGEEVTNNNKYKNRKLATDIHTV